MTASNFILFIWRVWLSIMIWNTSDNVQVIIRNQRILTANQRRITENQVQIARGEVLNG